MAERASILSALLASVLAAALASAAGLDRDVAVARARKALAERKQLEPALVETVSAVEQTWPDASLGCPRKDTMYAQVISRGWRVVLRVEAARYDVRVGPTSVVVCERDTPTPPARGEIEAARRIGELARTDLATRMRVPQEKVRVVSLKRTTWPDARLGCALLGSDQHGDAAATTEPGAVPGFLVTLACEDRTFTYHADFVRVVACEPIVMP